MYLLSVYSELPEKYASGYIIQLLNNIKIAFDCTCIQSYSWHLKRDFSTACYEFQDLENFGIFLMSMDSQSVL